MKRRLQIIDEQLTLKTTKYAKLQCDINELSKSQKEISNLLASPIFQCINYHLMENIALLVFTYSNLEYCEKHNTHFPKTMKQCIGCMTIDRYNNTFICNLTGPLKTKKIENHTIIIDFHPNDSDIKYHFMNIIEQSDRNTYMQKINNWSTTKLKSKKLVIYLVANTFQKEFLILTENPSTDNTRGLWQYNLSFDLK